MCMSGIKYIVDEKGNKTAVIIDLKKYGELWEELEAFLLYLERKDEPRLTLEEVQERLKKLGKLSA